ncbi:MAG: GerMN domain-containing protein [Bacillota bacterium]|nr:GerMN domain-containing protein [Bacillota bacterium]
MRRCIAGLILLGMLVGLLITAGCSREPVKTGGSLQKPGTAETTPEEQPGKNQGGPETGSDHPEISAKPRAVKQQVTLFFADREAMYLVPEEREVTVKDEPLEAVMLQELIRGPQKPGLQATIPRGTRLLSVSVVSGVAYVNLSKEFKINHWGGSAGERMTLWSVVNSLCKLPGIQKVQFLLEGEKQESILGHMGTLEPVAPDWTLAK